jgi:hypothetical protein
MSRVFDRVLLALAIVVAASLLASSWHDVSQAYDVWYYHLPFAARLVGIIDAKTYAFSPDNQARFEGFPLFGELVQGVLWRVTGHVAATNLLSLGALFALPLALTRAFRVPIHLAFLALIAIPLVQIHATSSYVDLPANVFATLLLLGVYRTYVADEPPRPRALLGYAALAAMTANTKFQLVPVVVASALALAAVSLRDLRRWGALAASARSLLKKRLAILVLAAPVVFATPTKNVIVHGNPVWPVELRLLGRSLPHAEEAYDSSPHHLAGASRPVRFVRSILEVDNRPIATRSRWSLDQWTPPDEPGYRMGGFFGAYVLVNLGALAFAVVRRRDRDTTVAGILFAGATVVASLVPQSHELRYYLFWMLLLVSLNLVLWARRARAVIGAVATVSLAVVAWSTEGGYLYPSGMSFDELLAKRVDRSVIAHARPAERICVAREPFDILYAPTFHENAHYTVQEAATEAECRR